MDFFSEHFNMIDKFFHEIFFFLNNNLDKKIILQEAFSEKNIPPTLIVTLDSDLVDSCQPGDCVTIWYLNNLHTLQI